MMEDEMRALRSELAKARSDAKVNAERMDAQQQKVEQQLAEAEEHEKEHHDLLFFRGGYAKMEHGRGYKNPPLEETLLQNTEANDNDGWYVGAGFDHQLTDDFWGLTDIASLDGEVMFEYKNFGTGENTLVNVVTGDTIENKITQFTLTAAPKIKFNNMGNFRPWIIPFGLGIHVISPPSSGVTVLNPGLMLGAGAEYKIWGDLWAGLDFRYHFTGDDLDIKSRSGALKGVDIDGLTAGAYLGFGF
jgi:opacity protein-like surface antigen